MIGDILTVASASARHDGHQDGTNHRISDSGPYDLRHFDVTRPDIIWQKLAAFRAAAPEELMLIADFDNTLTRRGCGIWEALRNALPEAGQAESDAERSVNLAKERAGTLSAEEVIIWSKHELARYAKFDVTKAAIEAAASRVMLRQGVQKLFRLCASAQMESHILSASVADAIEVVAKRKHLLPTQIHSNRLRTKSDVVIEWDEAHMFHNLNKHEQVIRLVPNGLPARNDRRLKFILGDTRYDADVVPDDSALRIRVRGKHGNTAAYLQESSAKSSIGPGFDLVLRTESLLPVARLLAWFIDRV